MADWFGWWTRRLGGEGMKPELRTPMFKPKPLLCLVLGLAGLAWALSAAAFQTGVLRAKASVSPERIAPQGKTQLSIQTSDGFQQPIPLASIKISADTGYFEASNQTTVFGYTDKDGVFQAVWHANLQTKPGTQRFEVTATKNGYLSKTPLTAAAKVVVEDLANPADTGDPQDEPNNDPMDMQK